MDYDEAKREEEKLIKEEIGREEKEIEKEIKKEEKKIETEIKKEEEEVEKKLSKEEEHIEKEIGEGKKRRFSRNDLIFLVAILVIIVVTLYFRLPLYKYQGFYEPDGFYHYAVIKAAIKDGFRVPSYLDLSGWPAHTPVSEPHGLYWVTLLPYAILHSIDPSISVYTVMRLVPLLFGLFDVFGAYYLARYLSKNRLFGVLVMLFVALSLGDAARTSALIYRGDGFVTIFLIVALIFFIKVLKEENLNKRIAYALLSGFFLSIGNYVWNGAPFATAVYIFAFAAVAIFSFAFNKKSLLRRSGLLIVSLIVWYIFVNIYKSLHFFMSQTFTGIHFVALLFFIALGWYLAYYILSNMSKYYKIAANVQRRIAFAILFLAAAVIVIDVAMPSFVYEIFIGNGFTVTNPNSFAGTIEELQPPTPGYLFASFGAFLFTTPMSIIIYISSIYSHKLVMWLLLLLLFAPYFFMQIENDKNVHTAKAYLKFEVNEAMLVMISYYAITAYLQIHAVRFNSLISIPLAILSAYTIYWLLIYFKGRKRMYLYAGYGIIVAFVLYTAVIDYEYSLTLTQADAINPMFLQALDWVRNNTPANSVFLTLWPDGSVIEGWANRTSVTDSVGSQNASKADPFALWLYNSSPDGQFLLSNINGKPDYLLVRSTWLLETFGIFVESGMNTSLENYYSYTAFTSAHEAINKTLEEFVFSNDKIRENTIIAFENNTQKVASYLVFPNGSISPVGYLAFVNAYNASFAIVRQTAYNKTNGGLMLIIYSPIPNPTMPINITGAFFFAPGLANSNMLKFLYFCNNNECLWNNNIARLDLVYMNPDTKIYKIIYNSTG